MTETGKNKTTFVGIICLLLTAVIWGSAFVAQDKGMEIVGPLTFSASRCVLGVAVLLPFCMIKDAITIKRKGRKDKAERKAKIKRTLILGGILGVIFTVAANLQQYAFIYSEPGKIAFITAFYMFFVPVIGLFMGKKVKSYMWFCVALGIIGMYFICIDPKTVGGINPGDFLSLLCAFFFAVHITFVEKYGPEVDGVKLSCLQFVVAAILSGIGMFIFEKPTWQSITDAWLPILYAGVASCGIAYTLQIVGQKRADATVASIIMCLEAVFAVVFQAIFIGTVMKPREALGCGIMLAAIIISQLAERIAGRRQKNAPDAS